MESYQVDGLLVQHVLPAGDAPPGRPPLLLLHGSGHGAWCWKLWLERLPALGWEAYAFSLRNHPGSRAVDEATYCRGTSVEDYAADVATVAAHVGRPTVLVGHSMGGIVAARFAALQGAAPDRVAAAPAAGRLAGLVLLTPAPPGQLGPLRDAPVPTDVPFSLPREVAAQRYFHTAAPEVLAWALDNICPESPSVVNQYSLGAGVPVTAEEIACPLLVVTAEHDHSVAPRDGRVADLLGGEWMHDADNGHDLMLEAGWSTLLERILAWLEPRTGTAGGSAGRG